MRSSIVLDVESSGARNTSELEIRARFDGMGVSSSEFSMSLSSISRNRRQYRKLLLKDARANRLSIITLNISSFSKKKDCLIIDAERFILKPKYIVFGLTKLDLCKYLSSFVMILEQDQFHSRNQFFPCYRATVQTLVRSKVRKDSDMECASA